METENLSFIVIEALLSETGKMELIRGYETEEVPSYSTHFAGKDELLFSLLDDQSNALYTETVPVIFNTGCATDSKRVGIASINKAIPLHSEATKIVAKYKNQEVFVSPIASVRPELSDLQLKVKDLKVELTFKTNVKKEGWRVYAKLKDKRLLKPIVEYQKGNISVELDALKGLEEMSFVLEVTQNFRSSQLVSDTISLPPSSGRGLIIEPENNSIWPFGKRGSLIASVFDENGRHLEWKKEEYSWRINGEAFGENEQLQAWAPKEEGDYSIQLLKKTENNQMELLHEVKVSVLPPNPMQKEYYRLINNLS